MSGSTALIIFVKEALAGKVKTRLAVSIGNKAALDVYRRLLDHTDDISKGLSRFIFYAGNEERIAHFDKGEDTWIEQSEGDLGERIRIAFAAVFAQGYSSVAIIGSDCAQLSSTALKEGLARCATDKLVLGPALDGGYYLLGLSEPRPALFDNMPWSTSEVAAITKSRALELGMSLEELTPLRDVDDIEDLEAIGWSGK